MHNILTLKQSLYSNRLELITKKLKELTGVPFLNFD